MKQLAILCSVLFAAQAMAADITTARIYFTAATTNGMTLGLARNNTTDVRTWAASASATEIATGTNSGIAATNLYTALASYPFTSVSVAYLSSNSLSLTSIPGATFLLGASDGYATIITTTAPENKIVDVTGTTTRYNGDSIISLDPTATIKDSAAAWTMTHTEIGNLANGLLLGFAGNLANFTNLPAAAITGTILGANFGTNQPGTAGQYLKSQGTNGPPYWDVFSVSSTNSDAAKLNVTNGAAVNSLNVSGQSTSDGVVFAARASTIQATNDVLQVQNSSAGRILGVTATGALNWGNMPTNASAGASPVRWLMITNAGTAYLIPVHAMP